jgi:hypothetical protein
MQKKALSEDRADDWAEAKSKVGQRAREEDMRSASEPGSREEDTIRVRCRDTGSEGGGYGARLSDSANMNSIELVDNTMSDMSAMQLMHGPVKKNVAPLEGRAEPQSCGNRFRKEGTQRGKGGGGEAPAVYGAHIEGVAVPNNAAGGIQAMRMMHAVEIAQ